VTPEEALAIFTDRKRAYVMVFAHDTPAHRAVMDDLTVFCRGKETCVVPGDRDKTFVLEGRREALLRIQDHLDLTPEQLLERYTRPA
jgi:hypothetical protein